MKDKKINSPTKLAKPPEFYSQIVSTASDNCGESKFNPQQITVEVLLTTTGHARKGIAKWVRQSI
jgi:hypothetical protein